MTLIKLYFFVFLIYQCFAVRGSADVRAREVLDSILAGMEITTGKDDTMEANAILDSLLRCIAENEGASQCRLIVEIKKW